MSLQSLASAGMTGRYWYSATNRYFRKVCRENGWCFETFIHVLAITSARAHLKKNVKLTIAIMRGETPVGLLPVVRIALKNYNNTGIIRGPKTSAFARALLGDENACVIDIWIERALKSPFPPNTSKRYAALEKRLRKAAAKANMPPAQFQAAVWCGMLLKENRQAVTYQQVMQNAL